MANFLGYTWADENRNLKRAKKLIIRALRAQPYSGHILDSIAWVEYRLGRYAEAEQWMRWAIEFSPADPLMYEHFGDILMARSDRSTAVEMYQKAISLEPSDADSDRIRRKISVLLEGKST